MISVFSFPFLSFRSSFSLITLHITQEDLHRFILKNHRGLYLCLCAKKFKRVPFKPPCSTLVWWKNKVFKRIMRKVLEVGVSKVALGRPCRRWCEWVRLSVKEQREGARPAWQEQSRGGGGWRGTRKTEEWEGKQEGERERRRWRQRIRGPLSLAWRPTQRGGRGRAAWLYSQPGDARSPSASSGPEPGQGEPAQRRRELQRGADTRSMQGERKEEGAVCTQEDPHREILKTKCCVILIIFIIHQSVD